MDDFSAKLRKHAGVQNIDQWLESLTEDEWSQIDDYIQDPREGMSKLAVSAIMRQPPFKGTTYRGFNVERQNTSAFTNVEVREGGRVWFDEVTSTSLDEKVAMRFAEDNHEGMALIGCACLLTLKFTHGWAADIKEIAPAQWSAEKEVLLRPGAEFRVDKVEMVPMMMKSPSTHPYVLFKLTCTERPPKKS